MSGIFPMAAVGRGGPGIVCGMRAEAARVPSGRTTLPLFCAGGSAKRAEAMAAQLIADGATALVSVGSCGALDPVLRTATLLRFDTVITEDYEIYAGDETLAPELPAGGALLSSDRALMTRRDKSEAFLRLGARAVDMESHGVARAAAAAGIPFTVVRAIADEAETEIPDFALSGLAPDGSTQTLPVLAGLLRRPWSFPSLLRLGRDTRRALQALGAMPDLHA